MKYVLLTIAAVGSFTSLAAQDFARKGLPYLRNRELIELQNQANHFYDTVKPIAAENKNSAVSVEYRGRRLALGTVTSAGVVSKWSELRPFMDSLTYRLPSGERAGTKVIKVLEEFDLAILSAPEGLTPVTFGAEESKLGEFLLVAGPGGEAHSLGVVGVATRSLRESDKAFLGVVMDLGYEGKGVLIKAVQENSGAAKSGLQAGDIVLQVNQQDLSGALEMGHILQKKKPGSSVQIAYERAGEQFVKQAKLGGRPNDLQKGPQERISKMRRMGAELSQLRSNFPSALQSDMPIEPEDCGGPVYNLKGEFIGIAIARASRTKSYIIPAMELQSLIEPYSSEEIPKALIETPRAVPAEIDQPVEIDQSAEIRSAEIRSQIEAKRRELQKLEDELRKAETVE